MKKFCLNLNKGFTLIELMISVGILVSTLCAIVIGLVSFMSLAEVARDKTAAVNDAQKVIEEIWDTPFSSIISTIEDTDWTEWASGSGDDNQLDNQEVTVTYDDSTPDLLEINVTVRWQTRNRPLSITLSVLKTKT